MMVPTAKGDPGRMGDADFECDARRDNGGVHTNSGVPNHAYALMVDGGTYNGVAVTGIGLTKAALIHYRALTEYLVSASNFLDHDNALRQACADLVGTAGITAGDCANAAVALDAVELSRPWPCTPNQPGVADLCPSGAPAIDLFFDNMENPASGNWIIQLLGGDVHWQYPPPSGAVFASSGVQNLFGENISRVGDSAIAMTADVSIAATGIRMQFSHAYGFDDDDDPTVYRDEHVDSVGCWSYDQVR